MSNNLTSDQYPGCLFFVPWEFDLLGGVDVVVDRVAYDFSRQRNLRNKIWRGIQDWRRFGIYPDNEGRNFLRINLPPPPTSKGVAWLRYAITLGRRLPGLVKIFKRLDIRIINCHFPTTNSYGLALLKKTGLWQGRLILSFHGSDVLAIDPQSHVWHTIASATDKVTACSHALAKQIADTGLWPLLAIQVIHNGIDALAFTSVEASPINLSGRSYFINVGNYTSIKAQDVLLNAFSKIASQYPDIDLVMVGGKQNGEWLSHLDDLAKTLNLNERVHFLTDVPHKQIPALMKYSMGLIHTSKREGFSLVLLEAGATGIPVIASNTGGIPEIISNPDLGVMFPVGDVNALASAIGHLIENIQYRNKLAKNLSAHIINNFSVEAMCLGYKQAIYNSAPLTRHGNTI